MVVLGIVASRNGHSRNGRIRNGRSRIGRSWIGTSKLCILQFRTSWISGAALTEMVW